MPFDGLSAQFDHNRYLVLRSAVKKRTVDLLHQYTLNYAGSGRATSDTQVPGAASAYGDPVMDRVLEDLLAGLEQVSGLQLYPTYSYFRVYRHGHVLGRHKDRPACEISLSLNLGNSGGAPWPLFIEGPHGICAAALQPGDALLYRGMECYHWREAFEGTTASQVFLHYVDRNGPHREWRFDKRPKLSRDGIFSPPPPSDVHRML